MSNYQEVIIAVDPGASGAIAVVIDGNLVEVEDMPHFKVKVGKTLRKRVDPATLDGLLKNMVTSHVGPMDEFVCIVEEVGPMPHDGPTQAFNFGAAYAFVIMAFVANQWPMAKVAPQVWKRALKLRKEKDAARQRAMELFPGHRAEAALIGHYLHLERRKGAR